MGFEQLFRNRTAFSKKFIIVLLTVLKLCLKALNLSMTLLHYRPSIALVLLLTFLCLTERLLSSLYSLLSKIYLCVELKAWRSAIWLIG